MSKTIEIPNNIPVSWLTRQERAEDESLFLVSVPDSRTETEYMSKYIKYGDIQSQLRETFNIGTLQQWVDALSASGLLTSLETNALCCATIPNPYIISAIYQDSGNITALDGYRLSDGMDYLFQNMMFEYIQCRNFHSTNIEASTIKVDNLSSAIANIANLSVTNIYTTENLVPSLYGYPLIEVEIDNNGYAYVHNKSVNYITATSDFRIDMIPVADELSEISKDFEVFVYAQSDCKIDFLFGEKLVTPNLEDEVISELHADNFYLFIISQLDRDTFYINRQTMRDIDINL